MSSQLEAGPSRRSPRLQAASDCARARKRLSVASQAGQDPSAGKPISPRVTTFALPLPQEHVGASGSNALSRSTNGSILSRLTRKLSQSKTQLVRRVSRGSRASRDTDRSPRPAEKALDENEPPVATGVVGIQRSRRVLGRSKSEGQRTRRADRLDVSEYFNAAGRTPDVEEEGKARLYWEERLGVCWDGREEVSPDLDQLDIPHYTSDADFVPEPRVVYASALSSFPPRPPLRSRNSEPGPAPEPSAHLSEASQIIIEYREACQRREAEQQQLTPVPSSPTDETPIRTPRLSINTVVDVPAVDLTSSPVSAVSDMSTSTGTPLRRFCGHRSEESNTSLESMHSPNSPVATRADKRPSKLSELTSAPMSEEEARRGEETASESSSQIDWRSCENVWTT